MSEHSLLKFVNYYFCIARFYSKWRFSNHNKYLHPVNIQYLLIITTISCRNSMHLWLTDSD